MTQIPHETKCVSCVSPKIPPFGTQTISDTWEIHGDSVQIHSKPEDETHETHETHNYPIHERCLENIPNIIQQKNRGFPSTFHLSKNPTTLTSEAPKPCRCPRALCRCRWASKRLMARPQGSWCPMEIGQEVLG